MGSENHVRSKLMEDENAVRAKKKKNQNKNSGRLSEWKLRVISNLVN